MINNKILFHADDYGRSSAVSENILKCLEQGCLNSVSVMVNHHQDSLDKLKDFKNVNIRLHLNLTEIPNTISKNAEFLSTLSFFKLLFLNKNKKKIVYKEIDDQITKFIKIYKPQKLKIDGHEHVHLIPWIYNYLSTNSERYKICEMRNSNEELMLPRLNDIFNPQYLRNLIACLIIKFFSFFNKEIFVKSPKFFGLQYSGMQDELTLKKTINFLKKKKFTSCEILVHPGFATPNERSYFKKKYYDFYISEKRKVEYELCFSEKIKNELNLN